MELDLSLLIQEFVFGTFGTGIIGSIILTLVQLLSKYKPWDKIFIWIGDKLQSNTKTWVLQSQEDLKNDLKSEFKKEITEANERSIGRAERLYVELNKVKDELRKEIIDVKEHGEKRDKAAKADYHRRIILTTVEEMEKGNFIEDDELASDVADIITEYELYCKENKDYVNSKCKKAIKKFNNWYNNK